VHEDVAQRGHLAGQFLVVLLLALVEAAVLQQHHFAGGHLHAIDPVRHETHRLAQQFGQACGHGGERVLGLEFTLGRAAQVAGHHHGGASVQRQADAGHAGADAGVFGDVAGVVLRHVQVGTDEHALALGLALSAQIGKTDECHGGDVRKRPPVAGNASF
jgi:hypothetical protein